MAERDGAVLVEVHEEFPDILVTVSLPFLDTGCDLEAEVLDQNLLQVCHSKVTQSRMLMGPQFHPLWSLNSPMGA